jgi:hypothetical protein
MSQTALRFALLLLAAVALPACGGSHDEAGCG